MGLCGKYIGDNDATCPQLTCIRQAGHEGFCDNGHGDGTGVPSVTSRQTAYLVGLINKETKQLIAADIFSEAAPTITKLHLFFTVVLFEISAASYGEAALQLRQFVATAPEASWLIPVLAPERRDLRPS